MNARAVSEIIRNRRPITLPAGATVRQACHLMHQHRIGAVLVVAADGALEGIFTGRDAVRLLAEGKSPASLPLGSVMTQRPETMAPHCKALDALRLMHDGGFRHIPLVDNGKVVGIASAGDFHALEHARLDDETGYWERL